MHPRSRSSHPERVSRILPSPHQHRVWLMQFHALLRRPSRAAHPRKASPRSIFLGSPGPRNAPPFDLFFHNQQSAIAKESRQKARAATSLITDFLAAAFNGNGRDSLLYGESRVHSIVLCFCSIQAQCATYAWPRARHICNLIKPSRAFTRAQKFGLLLPVPG